MQIVTKTAEETKEIAKKLVEKNIENVCEKSLIFLLTGELGTGKTTFTKGIGEYFGISKIISPSFVINCEYEIKNSNVKKINHFDFYNLKESEIDFIGLNESLIPGNVVVIEWPENYKNFLKIVGSKGKVIEIKMEHVSENKRKITI